ncbi:MAG: DUF4190 domain-containing protein [Chloroflexi bacterium]|nr:DUF4190 domain-containing protein [Chloroflexota bacterium]
MIHQPLETEAQSAGPRIDAKSIISLVLGMLTIASLCAGILPIPFTAFLCIPASLILGSAAVVTGMVSLNGIRKRNRTGRAAAWIGILTGGAVFLCLVLAGILLASLFVLTPDVIPTPPFFERYF